MYREQRKSRIRSQQGFSSIHPPVPATFIVPSLATARVGVADQALNFPNTLDGQHVSTVVKLE